MDANLIPLQVGTQLWAPRGWRPWEIHPPNSQRQPWIFGRPRLCCKMTYRIFPWPEISNVKDVQPSQPSPTRPSFFWEKTSGFGRIFRKTRTLPVMCTWRGRNDGSRRRGYRRIVLHASPMHGDNGNPYSDDIPGARQTPPRISEPW